jgi:hypothetical protein
MGWLETVRETVEDAPATKCRDCRHSSWDQMFDCLFCTHPKVKHIFASGETLSMYCTEGRSADTGPCGTRARFFESKETEQDG